jgi:UDP-N-acetyl-2-amino-2-deoxyglucuronate dehydrogenase
MNFALVGCGTIAKKHAHVITNYLKDSRIVACHDIDPAKAAAFAAKWGVGRYYSDINRMFGEVGNEIEIVNVLTPSGIHVANVLDLVRFGKPIVVEKPIALRLEDADEILRACDSNGVRIFVVHQNRFNTPIMKAREALEQGRFGKLVMGTVRLRWKRDQKYYDEAKWRGTWAYDGGVFTNQASHHIDMLSWFFGGIESVIARATTRLVNIECEDTGAAILKFVNGAMGIIEVTTATRPKDLEGSISILGEHGTVVIGGFFMNELTTWEFEDKRPEDELVMAQFGKNPEAWGHNLGEYLKDVIVSLKNNKSGLVDGIEGRKSLELISAIYESIETGQEVPLRFTPKKCKLGVV